MAKLTGAVIREQGVTFSVAIVKNHVVCSQSQSNDMIQYIKRVLGCPLVVLMGESNNQLRGNRNDVVKFVSSLHTSQIPWREYNIT